MPVYIYVCDQCDNALEVEHPMILDPDIECNFCSKICQRKPMTSGFIVR
jgi:putative FmdB family regulatory protein